MFRSPMTPRINANRPKASGGERSEYRVFDEGGHTVPRPPNIITQKKDLLDRFRARETQRNNDILTALEQSEQHGLQPEIVRSTPEPFTHLELGRIASDAEPELPVLAYKDIFLDSVANNQITICTAETGAGKSTQLPQYLLQAGYIVNMTQPRRISASLVAMQVQKELSAVLGQDADGLTGCHTGGENTIVESKTRITILTDGLRLVQEFGQRDEIENEVLIIDEVHEWNKNIDMLVAAVKRLMSQKPGLRVVILSATMEAEKLSEYFASGGFAKPPVIEIPGRNFDIERKEESDSTVVQQAVKYTEDGHNTLIFLPGVREIEDTISELKKELAAKGIHDATILPLHSKLSKFEQESVMKLYPGPKIICATNIAQTSITIPDVTRVIMSGLERRNEIDDEGVSSLNLRPVSRADLNQQAGRCGRVEDGEATMTRLNKDTEFISSDSNERTDYPIPEILRTDVDSNVLLAAYKGIDITELEFFHGIDSSVVKRSKHALSIIGALDVEGRITNQGRRMLKLPMRPMYARMATYAEDQKYTDNVRTYVAAMVSAVEVGGMPSWLRNSSRDWRDYVEETDDSDYLSQLRLFIAAQKMSLGDRYEIGLDVHNVERAQELYRKVCRRTGVPVNLELEPPKNDEVQQIRQAVTAGLIDYAYKKTGDGYTRAEGKTGEIRSKSSRSTIFGLPSLVVATPIGIERIRDGVKTREAVVQNLSAVTAENLGRVAAELCTWVDGGLLWRQGRLMRIKTELFRSIPTGKLQEVEAEATPESIRAVENYVIENSGGALTMLKHIKKELELLARLTTESLPEITQDDLMQIIRDVMDGQILKPDHVDQLIREFMDQKGLTLDNLISPDERQKIHDNSPPSIEIDGYSLSLSYQNGVPRHHVNDLHATLEWPETIRLPDSREVHFVYKERKLTNAKLRELAMAS